MSKRLFEDIERTAGISQCERYRYALGRHWDRSKGFVLFVMLNPSTADANKDDPTIRRCMGFARSWGYGGIEVCNLFDWRATDPKHLRNKLAIAVSDKNDPTLRCRVTQAARVIAAWGKVPWANARIEEVFRTAFSEEKRWECLGFTKVSKKAAELGMDDAFPRHPLYVPSATEPVVFW